MSLVEKLTLKHELIISILSVAELRSGWTEEETSFFLSKLYKLLKVKNLELNTVEFAGKLRWSYKRTGISLSMIDCLIAATTILNRCFLVTRNKKDYPITNIKLLKFE